jgi:phosphoenolpyruvate carboxykinase (ATP)
MSPEHHASVWLGNTGWSGGPYGVGQRMAIAHTRAMVRSALTGARADAPAKPDPVFGLAVPTACPNVPPDVLDPRSTWSDPQAYDVQANTLAAMFAANFETFASTVADQVRAAGPRTRCIGCTEAMTCSRTTASTRITPTRV